MLWASLGSTYIYTKGMGISRRSDNTTAYRRLIYAASKYLLFAFENFATELKVLLKPGTASLCNVEMGNGERFS